MTYSRGLRRGLKVYESPKATMKSHHEMEAQTLLKTQGPSYGTAMQYSNATYTLDLFQLFATPSNRGYRN